MSNLIKGSHSSQPERFCKYIHRYCNQTRLEGYDYCIRHILEDKSAPFKRCVFVNQLNQKRCTNAAPKSVKNDKRDNALCPFHAKRAMLKVRIAAPKKKSLKGPTAFLKSFEHYCKDPKHDPTHKCACTSQSDVPLCKGSVPTTLSDIESATEDVPLEDKAHVENIDEDFCWVEKPEDYLANAGAYTHKEVLTIAKEKIQRLQHLYCEELKVVYRELRENRKQFLAEVKNVKQSLEENDASQHESNKSDTANLQAYLKHYKRSGTEKVMQHRAKTRYLNAGKPLLLNKKCSYEKMNKKCNNDAIAFTKFCKMHILMDTNQLLYKPCSFGGREKCMRPVLVLEENASCDLHLQRMLKSNIKVPAKPSESISSKTFQVEPEPFQSMDDIASLGLDAIAPGSLFGLDQFGEPGESTDTVLSEDQTDFDLLTIQPISSVLPNDILSDSRKSEINI